MISALRSWINEKRFRKLVRDLDRREALARAANDCRAIGQVKRERYGRVHEGLKAATAWRGAR